MGFAIAFWAIGYAHNIYHCIQIKARRILKDRH
ncbi:Uncharacterised protein [Klebsiella oxytoca]|uniref:Uncharacterized protein n=1 Tax=Klebsiella oxytoca TaxID=571 RepID=A0A6N3ALH7_KLEOX|nr:hypothetical protein AN2363V1_2771 [Klebsiella oxytoca]CAH6102043.1 hypothetical protein AN2363V1_2771 [Klebsiella oxytoca]STR22556.1 Uncharacterised protein [Klebsiella oxytoca]